MNGLVVCIFFNDWCCCAHHQLGPVPPDSPTLIATTMSASSSSASVPPQKGWSKQNLRPGERSAWTRGRDGWSGVGVGGHGSMVEGSGEVRFVFRLSIFFLLRLGCSFIIFSFSFSDGS